MSDFKHISPWDSNSNNDGQAGLYKRRISTGPSIKLELNCVWG